METQNDPKLIIEKIANCLELKRSKWLFHDHDYDGHINAEHEHVPFSMRFRVDRSGYGDRIEVRMFMPREVSEYKATFRRHWSEPFKPLTASASATRDPKVIAKEFRRKLFGDYAEQYAATLKLKHKYEKQTDGHNELVRKLIAVVPKKDLYHYKTGEKIAVHDQRVDQLRFSVDLLSVELEIRNGSVSAQVFFKSDVPDETVVEFMKSLQAIMDKTKA